MLEGMKDEYKLPDAYKITALEQIMGARQAKLYFESLRLRNLGYEDILKQCREYALRRRLEHRHKKGKDDMDLDGINNKGRENIDMGGGYWNQAWSGIGRIRGGTGDGRT